MGVASIVELYLLLVEAPADSAAGTFRVCCDGVTVRHESWSEVIC